MINILKMANSEILLSHKRFYNTPKSFNKILGRNNRKDLLLRLSFLSYGNYEESRFRKWSDKSICQNKKQREYAMGHAVFSRLQCWRLWKVLFNEWISDKNSQDRRFEYEVLHEAFAKLNDRFDGKNDSPHQVFLKTIVSHGRDNIFSKLRRSQHIFCADSQLTVYVNEFEKKINAPIKSYVNTIYFMINHWHKMIHELDYNFRSDEWSVSTEWLSSKLKIPVDQITAILKEISISISDGRKLSQEDKSITNDFTLYRERPLLQIEDNKFIPIEGKILEELLFENLFHKIHQANNYSNKFLIAFGFSYEKYAQLYGMKFMQGLEQYKIIEEFDFKIGRNKKKSSDLMIFIPKNDCMIIFEFKSARPLYNSLTRENDLQSVRESLDKLQEKPWAQAMTTLTDIVQHKIHSDFNENTTYFIVSVTMNNYPMTLQELIVTNSDGNNVSAYFHSFDIETFEILMRAARLSSDYLIDNLLYFCHERIKLMSSKTTLVRYMKNVGTMNTNKDKLYYDVCHEAIEEHNLHLQ